MKDEIKEILNYFIKYMSDSDCIKLSKIEDYITNLQEKLDFMIDRNDEKQNKIDKANDYIKQHSNNFVECLYVEEVEELSNILGGDKE